MNQATNILQAPGWADKESALRRARSAHLKPGAEAANAAGYPGNHEDAGDPGEAILGALAAAAGRKLRRDPRLPADAPQFEHNTIEWPEATMPRAAADAAKRRLSRKVNVQIEEEDLSTANKIIDVLADATLSEQDKYRAIDEIDPDRRVIEQMISSGEVDLANKKAEADKRGKLVRSYERAQALMKTNDGMFALQKNECSRLHKFIEACQRGMFFDNEVGDFCEPRTPDMGNAQVIVVRHDWAAAFGDSFEFDPADAFKLPFPNTIFEFRISGLTVLAAYKEADAKVEACLTFEGVEGIWWSAFDGDDVLHAYVERQVRAICVALEAQVAEHVVTRAPHKLNAKRAREGKPPLFDFFVVDLSRRIRARTRAERRPDAQPTGRRVRLHFRRGHWRHYEDHKTWIEWMLVGDPDLGFIDKHYRV